MFKERLGSALDHLATTGIWRSSYAPPLFCLLWRCNLQVAPPHFRSFRANAVMLGSYFGVFSVGVMLLLPPHGDFGAVLAIILGSLAGLFFGLSMADYYRRGRRKHNLPDWESLSVE